MKEVKEAFKGNLQGKTFLVQGFGNVGKFVIKTLESYRLRNEINRNGNRQWEIMIQEYRISVDYIFVQNLSKSKICLKKKNCSN